MVMADVKNRLGRRDEAIAVLRQGLEATKGTDGYAEILYDLVNAYISRRQVRRGGEMHQGTAGHPLPPLDMPYPPQLVEFLEAQDGGDEGRLERRQGNPRRHPAQAAATTPASRRWPICYLGQCYHQQGDVEQQIIAYSEALKIDPYLSPARAGLAEIFMSRGNFAEAAEQYRMLLKGPHPDAEAALSLARILIMMRLREDKEKRDWEPVDKLLDQIERQELADPQPCRAQGGSAAGERSSQGGGRASRSNAPRSSPRTPRSGWP